MICILTIAIVLVLVYSLIVREYELTLTMSIYTLFMINTLIYDIKEKKKNGHK